MMRSIFIVSVVLGLAAAPPADARSSRKPSRAFGTASLVRQLRANGLTVAPAGTISQPFFTPKARVYRVNGGDLQVYEYKDAASAAKEAGRVSTDGSIGGSMPMWIAPPHFFRKDRIIAIYLGSNAKALSGLAKSLGPQFAGK